ncbi:MAG: S8 family serine peptidase [Anaerolineae bacterium]
MLKRVPHTAIGLILVVGLLVMPPAATGQPPSPGRAGDGAHDTAGPHIRLQAASFDPLHGRPAVRADRGGTAANDLGVYLIQFHGPIQPEWKAEVTAAGAELFDYIPDFAFVARMDAAVARRVAALPAVRWVGSYQPAYRVSPSLRRGSGQALRRNIDAAQETVLSTTPSFDDEPVAAESRPAEVRISTFPDAVGDVGDAVRAAGGRVIRTAQTAFGGTLRAMLLPGAIADLARSPGVRWIESAPHRRLLNDVARSRPVMNVEQVWDLGLFGTGQIVAVSDSGLDVGDMETLSADFRGRVLAVHPLGEEKTTWNDPVGHGTHVAGSIAGNGALSGSDPTRHDYAGGFAGVAPDASLVVQAFSVSGLLGEVEGLPEDLNVLFQQAYDDGARIHSNSWGGSDEDNPDNPYGGYPLDAQEVDEFAWSHPDMTILFAAGNSGTDSLPDGGLLPGDGVVDPDSINVPGTAKNVITVGASESLRPPTDDDFSSRNMQWVLVGLFTNVFLQPPIMLDFVSDNINGMAAFSSRGPTDDGRIKPDVVAPGTNIVSARSHDPNFEPLLGSWGPYEANDNYVYNGGTSMATPLVAGAATLVRQWYIERQGLPNPPSALIKATLINGAVDMTPGQYGTGPEQEIPPRPNFVEGWGRINIQRSLVGAPPRRVWFDDHRLGLQTGDRIIYEDGRYELEVVNFAIPLHVTLVWTDYPGSPAAESQLVNDLDLTVVGPDGRQWHGNEVDGDRTNNVEGVEIGQPARGRYRIIVEAHNVPLGPQPYALVVAGGLTREGVVDAYMPIIGR